MTDCKSDTLVLNTYDDWYELWDVGVVVLFQVIDTNNCVLSIKLPGGTNLSDTTYYEGESKTYTENGYTYVVTVTDISIWGSGAKTANVKVCRTELIPTEGFLELKSFAFADASTSGIITEAKEGQLVKAIFTVSSEFSDDFWVVASIGTTQVYNEYFSLAGTDLKTIVTTPWTMGITNSVITIILRHKISSFTYADDLYTTKTLYLVLCPTPTLIGITVE